MTIFSWLWLLLWGLTFAVLETTAIIMGDKPGQPRTLTANVRALITGRSWWHRGARLLVAALLAWLPGHFGIGG